MLRVVSWILCLGALVACRDEPDGQIRGPGRMETGLVSLYQPFPPGYGYMEDPGALQAAVLAVDRSLLRRHGWNLWAGIMQPGSGTGWPVWQTWPNTTLAFSGGAPPEPGCGRPPAQATSDRSVRRHGLSNVIEDDIQRPKYVLPQAVRDEYPSVIFVDSHGDCTVRDGRTFQNNGDIMIVTESLSIEAYEWIRGAGGEENDKLYEQATLGRLHEQEVYELEAPQRHIVTKHMYWPVPKRGLGVLPVWNDDFGPEYTGYAGYERWTTFVAVDPTGTRVGENVPVEYLFGDVDYSDMPPDQRSPQPIVGTATVVDIEEFYHHRVTPDDWESFDAADRAILNASSQWAYGQPFGPDDYLVTIAMHINTKEVPSWALQSVYWSDRPDEGAESRDRPPIPKAEGPWAHYKLVASYGIPDTPGGTRLPVAMNPYIELVIHPVATNCHSCHARAGWPPGPGPGQSSYQPSRQPGQGDRCRDMLERLTPSSSCLEGITLTDMQWIIPDRAIP